MYRACLSVFTVLAIGGNLVSFVIRMIVNKVKRNASLNVFVANLYVSDFFFMGLYQAIIGVADRLYLGAYL